MGERLFKGKDYTLTNHANGILCIDQCLGLIFKEDAFFVVNHHD